MVVLGAQCDQPLLDVLLGKPSDDSRCNKHQEGQHDEHCHQLSFDSAEGRRRTVTGTTDWELFQLIVDVPDESFRVVFGMIQVGTGQAWVDEVRFEILE